MKRQAVRNRPERTVGRDRLRRSQIDQSMDMDVLSDTAGRLLVPGKPIIKYSRVVVQKQRGGYGSHRQRRSIRRNIVTISSNVHIRPDPSNHRAAIHAGVRAGGLFTEGDCTF